MPTQAIVSVPALCSFEHEGRSYVCGEVVDVPPATALALARAKKVSLGRHAAVTTREIQAEDTIETPRTRRRYRRRDMRAET